MQSLSLILFILAVLGTLFLLEVLMYRKFSLPFQFSLQLPELQSQGPLTLVEHYVGPLVPEPAAVAATVVRFLVLGLPAIALRLL